MTFDPPDARAGQPGRRPPVARRRRSRALLPTAVVVGLLISGFGLFTGFYTDLLWFRSVGFAAVFSTRLFTRVLLFLVFGLLLAAVVATNFIVAYRSRPAYQPMVPGQQELDRYRMTIEPYRRFLVLGVAGLLGMIAGSSAAGEWRVFLQWRNAQSFGVKDPQFGKDVSFFAFTLPWWRFVLGFMFAAVVLSLLAAAATHYLYGGLRLQAQGERVIPAARAHLSVLLGLFVLLKAVSYWLDRYSLAVKEGTRIVGLQYTDVQAVLPVKTFLAGISVVVAVLFFANVVVRTWLLPAVGVGLLLACVVVAGGVYPAIVQRFQVRPAEPDREADYIERNIKATRTAYQIDNVEKTDYNARTEATPGQLRGDADTTASVRLLDPAVVGPTFKNLQQIRSYYEFPNSLDIDRYTIDGQIRDTVVSVRELDLAGLPQGQRNWVNDHLVYTHGFGFVAALGNQRDADGRPSLVSANIPPTGKLGQFEPRVYFGEKSPSYSIVGAAPGGAARELDYPDDRSETGARQFTYTGKGGVPIGSLLNKLFFSVKYQEANILLSNRLSGTSKILYEREPRDRVEKVAPWLTLDGDPYPAVVDGRILWIVDGYTTTNGYPYSSRTTLGDVTTDSLTTRTSAVVAPIDRVNYIRNSVKATVDAYDGTVTLYEWDDKDPVLKTWRKAFPGTVKDRSAISPGLLRHLRYPEDFFKVQRTLLARYHVTDAQAFYQGSDFWRIPRDPTRRGGELQPPYFLTLQMPGQKAPSFSLTTTFVPNGERENLAAFMAVNATPGPDYGKIRVLQLPRSVQINGPRQVQNNFSSDSAVAGTLNILGRGDSQVVFGNLLTLPVGGGLLYVEPVYVQSSAGTSFPLLRKVLVSFGERVAFEDTLQQALDSVFQGNSGAQTPDVPGGAATTPPPSGGATAPPTPPAGGAAQNVELRRALEDANRALQDGQAALAKGDFTAYGAAQARLRAAISRALAAESRASRPTGRAAASPSPSPAPAG